jgi:tetratricopeptide (TPR) repeat protein
MFARKPIHRMSGESRNHVTHTPRLRLRIAALALAFVVLSPEVWAANDVTALGGPSATGGYLAGREALHDMDTKAASRFFLDGTQAEKDNPVLLDRAFISLAASGDVEGAAALAGRLVKLDPGNDMAHLVIATSAFKNGDYARTLSEVSGMGTDNYAGISGMILRAWAYVGLNDLTHAESVLANVSPSGLNDFVTFHRALMAEVAGQPDEALKLAAEAYKNNTLVPEIVGAYAQMLANAGHFIEAMKPIEAFESQGLDDPEITALKEQIKNGQRPGPAFSTPQQGGAEMFHSIGGALQQQQSDDLALVFLRLGLYLAPGDDMIAMNLAEVLDGAGRYAEANDIYARISPQSAFRTLADVRAAQNLESMGQRDEAIANLKQIVARAPQDSNAISALADALRAGKQYAAAAEAYTTALALLGGDTQEGNWRYYYTRGVTYDQNKQWDKAEADFKTALKLSPDQADVLNYLGYSWVDRGVHLDEALAMIKRAVDANPNDGYYVDSLGWAYYKLGRIDDAVKSMEQAVQLLPDDPEINGHLGDVYWQAGRKREARFQWQIASDLAVGNPELKAKMEDRIKNGFNDSSKP